jgi:hypothetical protein
MSLGPSWGGCRGAEDGVGEAEDQRIGWANAGRQMIRWEDRAEVRSSGQVVENSLSRISFLETRLGCLTGSEWTRLDLNRHGKKDRFEKSIARKLTFSLFHPFSSALFLTRMRHELDMDP